MFNTVPLAGPRREVTDSDRQARAIREPLQFPLPEPKPCAVAAAGVGGDQERPRLRVGGPPHALPPPANRVHREAGRVVIDPDTDPSFIAVQIVDAVRDGLPVAGPGITKSCTHPIRRPFRPPGPPAILEVANQFLLFRVHRDGRLLPPLRPRHEGGDIPELGIAIRMLTPLARLHVPLGCSPTGAGVRRRPCG